ncbi:hypothetical protein PSQ20_21595 [Curvibacter sp. RS43]|uniref:hypothetical protein n=1 Tax=Curvibacter microcysteis TaxID=3026419 RepID=UPI00235FF817|nr:hypothetical protein [Curvibacter sp. RS43]MDD0812945.1 hypothetical protein [Curvibacter sp. RS43]
MHTRTHLLQRYAEIALMSIGLLAHIGFLLKLVRSESQETKVDRKIKLEAVTLIKEALRLARIVGGNFQLSIIESGAISRNGSEKNKALLVEIKNTARTISIDLHETVETVETALEQLIETPTCGHAWNQEWRLAFDALHIRTQTSISSIMKALEEVQNFPFNYPHRIAHAHIKNSGSQED